MSGNSELLDERESAEYLRVPAGTLKQWRYLGRGPTYARIGRHVRYRRSDLVDYVAAQLVDPQHAA